MWNRANALLLSERRPSAQASPGTEPLARERRKTEGALAEAGRPKARSGPAGFTFYFRLYAFASATQARKDTAGKLLARETRQNHTQVVFVLAMLQAQNRKKSSRARIRDASAQGYRGKTFGARNAPKSHPSRLRSRDAAGPESQKNVGGRAFRQAEDRERRNRQGQAKPGRPKAPRPHRTEAQAFGPGSA